ncbi:YcfA-like protein, partial [Candidatus Magnetoovum chiemensis]
CVYYREGKGDHKIYMRYYEGKKRIVPIDMGAKEFSPFYALRILRQFGFTDSEIEYLLENKHLED